jgi:M6 family metalloprotease-like protein
LIDDIVSAHDDTVDFGQFDNDGPDGIPNSGDDDGYVDAIVMMHPDVDGACKNKNHAAEDAIWAHRFNRSGWSNSDGLPYVTNDSSESAAEPYILVDDYIIQGGQGGDDGCVSNEPQAMGLVAHEVGHLLGLPDLYDNTTGGSGIGRWGLMGSGNWRLPHRPAHMTAWSKGQLGWVTEVLVDRDTTLDISPIVSADTSYIVPIDDTNEYFILENRQPLGSDTELFREGLLVFLADTFLIEQRGNWVNSFRPYALALIQADGRDDLLQGVNKGDESDPFPGLDDNTLLGVCTDPASNSNFDGPSLVILDSISQVEPLGAIRANIRFFQPDQLVTDDQSFEDEVMGQSFARRLAASGGIDCDRRWSVVGGSLPTGLLLAEGGLLSGRLEEAGSFTAQLEVRSGQQADTAVVTMSVGVPALSLDAVVGHLLGAPSQLGFFDLNYLDLQGNRNGEFDLGDFLGWIESTGGSVSAAEMAQIVDAADVRSAGEVRP